jgi:hypothetical protein
MNYTVGQLVNRIEDRSDVAAVILTIEDRPSGQFLELSYTEGGSGWWPASCVEIANE